MIHINKPPTPPAILTTRGAAETQKHCIAYESDRRGYRNGTKTFDFDGDIYGHPSVKDALKQAQHDKCAFCESVITHVQYGDVEHFRPKKGVRRGKDLTRPGYYWLAYDWDNLLLACQICNQRYKGNAFPLVRGSRRARSHLDSVAREHRRDRNVTKPWSFSALQNKTMLLSPPWSALSLPRPDVCSAVAPQHIFGSSSSSQNGP